ncbi:hypothetical protein AB4090_07840 [Acidithiobacillus sp. IBUN Pt1247-S3]|uniref:hypothetical protein n=1 Tax=Acidithiobacillus sp. IBUN Pt1247-S3 TaxID=3166642 RepID=UPI0034E38FD9
MVNKHGLLVLDLQTGFSHHPDCIESIRDLAQEYEVVVATRFSPPADSKHRQANNYAAVDGGSVIDVGHDIVIEKTGYGLSPSDLSVLRGFSEVTEWGLAGSRSGACILACAFSLWDAGIPFHVVRSLCNTQNSHMREAMSIILQQQFGV